MASKAKHYLNLNNKYLKEAQELMEKKRLRSSFREAMGSMC
ncbi:MAG: hypothetical protein ACUVTD_03760 [Nitrososphaerales archaeon]